MALDSSTKRRSVLGIGRPWYRSSLTTQVAGVSNVTQRAAIGYVYGGNGLTGVLPDVLEAKSDRVFVNTAVGKLLGA